MTNSEIVALCIASAIAFVLAAYETRAVWRK